MAQKAKHETEMHSFLREITDLRIKGLSEQAHLQPDFIKINQATLDYMESITDTNVHAALLAYEDLKNEYISLMAAYLYEAGASDILTLCGMLSKLILR